MADALTSTHLREWSTLTNKPLGKTEESLKRSSGDASWSLWANGRAWRIRRCCRQNKPYSSQTSLNLVRVFSKDASKVTRGESDQLSLGRNEKGVVSDTQGQSGLKAPIDVDKNKQDKFWILGSSAPEQAQTNRQPNRPPRSAPRRRSPNLSGSTDRLATAPLGPAGAKAAGCYAEL